MPWPTSDTVSPGHGNPKIDHTNGTAALKIPTPTRLPPSWRAPGHSSCRTHSLPFLLCPVAPAARGAAPWHRTRVTGIERIDESQNHGGGGVGCARRADGRYRDLHILHDRNACRLGLYRHAGAKQHAGEDPNVTREEPPDVRIWPLSPFFLPATSQRSPVPGRRHPMIGSRRQSHTSTQWQLQECAP